MSKGDTGVPGAMSHPARKAKGERLRCVVTGEEITPGQAIRIDTLRPALVELIRGEFPDCNEQDVVSASAIAAYRRRYITDLLTRERGELSHLEEAVIESLHSHENLAANVDDDFLEKRTLGEVLADHVANFGGSWMFIISFGVVIAIWIAMNLGLGEAKAFDVYPFILLNLVLSCLAAIQAPIIMMSQKRQDAKDRLRSRNDYQVNLKAELEIRHLHEKIDHLLHQQWERLAEIQQVQIEIMNDLAERSRKAKKM